MTPEQQKALIFIGAYINTTGCSPTLDEIAAGLGMQSKSSAHRVVGALIDLGHLRRTAIGARGIEMVRQPSASAEQLATRLAAALADQYGIDDGEGVLICGAPEEFRATLLAAMTR